MGFGVIPRKPRDMSRAQRMADLYKSGKTLQEIADEYGVTRERVRQIISAVGVKWTDGGRHKKAVFSALSRQAKKEGWALKNKGCTYAQYKLLRGMKTPTRAYSSQVRNAWKRGIEWKFTLWSWWLIWSASGKWDQRGRGQGKYVMARYGDAGAYEPGNVFICLAVENNSNRPQKKSDLPCGVHFRDKNKENKFVAKKMIGGRLRYIGAFKTPDAAHAAYQSFSG